MSFLTELRRRKVVRVALVYAATAFVVLHFRDVRYSPDGHRNAATIVADRTAEVWVHDIASGTLLPITRGVWPIVRSGRLTAGGSSTFSGTLQ